MARFRFRAQAALDLRRRALDAAQRDLARAEGDRDRAQAAVSGAIDAVNDGRAAMAARLGSAAQASELQWYRFWILRLDHERAACRTRLAAREQAVAEARNACVAARQQCESLVKLRDKLRKAHEDADAAAERKLIDELATRRFVAARMEMPPKGGQRSTT